MPQKIKVRYTVEINWPNSCASCKTLRDLVAVQATSGKITSVSPILTGVKVSTELLNLNYPVCKTHAKGLGLANFLTRKTLGPSLMRGMFIVFGPPAIFLYFFETIHWVQGLFSSHSNVSADSPLVFTCIFLICAIGFILLVMAYRKIPIRILSQGRNDVILKFKNDAYAKDFIRLNQHSIVK